MNNEQFLDLLNFIFRMMAGFSLLIIGTTTALAKGGYLPGVISTFFGVIVLIKTIPIKRKYSK